MHEGNKSLERYAESEKYKPLSLCYTYQSDYPSISSLSCWTSWRGIECSQDNLVLTSEADRHSGAIYSSLSRHHPGVKTVLQPGEPLSWVVRMEMKQNPPCYPLRDFTSLWSHTVDSRLAYAVGDPILPFINNYLWIHRTS